MGFTYVQNLLLCMGDWERFFFSKKSVCALLLLYIV